MYHYIKKIQKYLKDFQSRSNQHEQTRQKLFMKATNTQNNGTDLSNQKNNTDLPNNKNRFHHNQKCKVFFLLVALAEPRPVVIY